MGSEVLGGGRWRQYRYPGQAFEILVTAGLGPRVASQPVLSQAPIVSVPETWRVTLGLAGSQVDM